MPGMDIASQPPCPPPPPPPPLIPKSAASGLGVPPSLGPGALCPPPPPPMVNGVAGPMPKAPGDIPDYLTCPGQRHSLPANFSSSTLWAGHSSTPQSFSTLPRKRMRTLNWTKVPPNVIDNSIWKSQPAALSYEMSAHLARLEELFCQKSASTASTRGTNTRPKSSPPGSRYAPAPSEEVNLLDSKRSLAVNIFLRQLKKSPEEVVKILQKGDATALGVERLQALVKLLPEKAEVEMVKSFAGDHTRLGLAEKFYDLLAGVTAYELRVDSMLLKEELESRLGEVQPQLEAIVKACDDIKTNESLKEFLLLVLQLGNYLNQGSYAGNAVGFKLNALPKLLEMRANAQHITFLHYVVDVATNCHKNALVFIEELASVSSLSRLSLEAILDDVNKLVDKVRSINEELQKAPEDVQSQFSDFLSKALEKVNNLTTLTENAQEAWAHLAKHFCEDPVKFTPEEGFKLLADFFQKVNQALKDNEQHKKREARKALIEKNSPKVIMKTTNKQACSSNAKSAIDMLMEEIRGGNFQLRNTKISTIR
ncbi:Formin-like protein [Gryllus bimaculatus]|nr:Formin-like protein [Gryllus bimaculatus]